MDLEDRARALEEGWFRANEKQLLKAARERREARLAAEKDAERQTLRAAHWMRCPKCGDPMTEVELSGVKVDKCGHCDGVFFDAGELDDLLVKSAREQRGIFRKLTGLFED